MEIEQYYNKIVLGDCVKVMAKFPDGCVDMAITSPPYDNLRDYKEFSFDFGELAKQLWRVLKKGGVVVWVVGDATVKGSETGTSFKQVLGFMEVGFNLHDTMIYEKNGSSYPSNSRYYQIFEYMFVLSKGKPRCVNLLCDRENRYRESWGRRSRRTKSGELQIADKILSNKYGKRFNVWRYNTGAGFSTKDKIAYQHPAIFPEKLAEDHIYSWSNEGDTVLDPFFGSGTVGVAAKRLRRNYIGIEIAREYCVLARQRIDNDNVQYEEVLKRLCPDDEDGT